MQCSGAFVSTRFALEDLSKDLRLVIKGCRRLLRERQRPQDELELFRQILANAERELAEIERRRKEQ